MNGTNQGLSQGILMAAQGLSEGINQYRQNKMMANDAIGKFEGAAQENPDMLQYLANDKANPELKRAFQKLQKDGNVGLKDAALLSSFSSTFLREKQQGMARQQQLLAQQQAQTDQRALAAAMNQFLPQNGQPAPFNPQRFLGTYFQSGGSPQSLDKVDQALKMFAPQPGRPVLDLKSYRSADPATGKPIEVTVDELTGKEVGRGPLAEAAKTEINMGGDSYEREVGKMGAEQHMKEYTAANDAPYNISKLDEVKSILETGDPTTGIGAELLNNVNRIRSNFMADKKAGKSVTDTQVLDAMLGSDVFPQIAALGIGARGLDTPQEREYLRNVMTGTINLDKDALIRMTDIRRNIQMRALEKFKRSYDKGTYKKFFEVTGNPVPDLSILEVKQEAAEAPKLPEGWKIVQ